jgi:hypothetical protein
VRYGACVPANPNDLGAASGFNVEEYEDGSFRWTAFGPAGTREGTAESRADAEAAAQAAERELSDPSQAPRRADG